MKIAILGTGALGCLLAAKLQKGHEVVMFGNWETQKEAIRSDGLWFTDLEEQQLKVSVRIGEIMEEGPRFDLVLVLVKSYQTKRVALDAARLIHLKNPEARVITLQNGLGNAALLETQVPGRVLVGTTTVAAKIQKPGQVAHTGKGAVMLPRTTPEHLVQLFKKAGFEVKITLNIESLIWTKLAVNAAINPITAMLRVQNGELLDHPESLKWMKAICAEVEAVARMQGIKIEPHPIFPYVKEVAAQTAKNRSSMLSDVETGRPTEIEAICEKVIEIAEDQGIAVPYLKQVYAGVKAAEQGRKFDFSELPLLIHN
ncbi:MAG: 2-dehydropantoate 2-reductase [Bacteroidetes bacterium]|nr:2-dehydropantoate 2-reductase [Bacteroidota bacterium]